MFLPRIETYGLGNEGLMTTGGGHGRGGDWLRAIPETMGVEPVAISHLADRSWPVVISPS